jgi:hypothetical protein
MRPLRDRTWRPDTITRRVAPAAIVIVVASLALLGWAVSMLSSGNAGRADYASFKQCPVPDPQTDLCLFTQTTGGEFVAGDKTVPLSRTITLQGGIHVVENKEREIVKDEFIAARNGETMSRAPQPVPGGLRGVVDPELLPPALRAAFDELLAKGNTEVTATIELAAPASSIGIDVQNLIEAQGTALVLPLKIKLSNTFLGESCHIGSNLNPMSLPLTTGKTDPPKPNDPITGKVGKAKLKDDYNLTVITASSLVNNTFAAPGVEGCGGTRSPALDRAMDAKLGLPATGGHNTAILDGTLEDANAPAVRAGE